jgi:hypothetical protein
MWIGQPMRWELSGALFPRSSKVCPTLLGQRERLPHMGTARRKHMSDVHGLTWEAYVSCVSGFPYRVYINLNQCDYHI